MTLDETIKFLSRWEAVLDKFLKQENNELNAMY